MLRRGEPLDAAREEGWETAERTELDATRALWRRMSIEAFLNLQSSADSQLYSEKKVEGGL